MKPVTKSLALPTKQFYEKHLTIVNIFLPVSMTPKEIEVLSVFMSLEGDMALDRFGTSARKIVMNKVNIVPGGLGNYLRDLKKKGFIIDTPQGLTILPLLHPSGEQQDYYFKLQKI